MNFQVKKSENCFSDCETYEYQLPLTGKELLGLLNGWNIQVSQKLRRPAAIAEKNGVVLKCTLSGNLFRVSFPSSTRSDLKEEFEFFLRNLP